MGVTKFAKHLIPGLMNVTFGFIHAFLFLPH